MRLGNPGARFQAQPALRPHPLNSDLQLRLQRALGDLEHLVGEVKKAGGTVPDLSISQTQKPRNRASLAQELALTEGLNAYLSGLLIQLRGESVFAPGSGFDRLAKFGLVVAPTAQARKSPGRPPGKGTQTELAFWTDFVLTYEKAKNRPTKGKKRWALRIAHALLEARRNRKPWQEEIVRLENAYARGKKALRNFRE